MPNGTVSFTPTTGADEQFPTGVPAGHRRTLTPKSRTSPVLLHEEEHANDAFTSEPATVMLHSISAPQKSDEHLPTKEDGPTTRVPLLQKDAHTPLEQIKDLDKMTPLEETHTAPSSS